MDNVMIMIIAPASAIQPLRTTLLQTLHTACKFIYDKSRANLMSLLYVGCQGQIRRRVARAARHAKGREEVEKEGA